MFGVERNNLTICGKSVVLKPRFPPFLATRKIFNSTFFRNEQYHHEIANHYRDFKRRPRIRRKRRNAFLRYRKATPLTIPIGTNPYDYRDELPLPKQNFTRFALVQTPTRGRQCLCVKQAPDETFNDSVRRIRAAKGCDELRDLVQRYIHYIGYVAKRAKHQRQQKIKLRQTCPNESAIDSKQQASSKQQKHRQQQQQQQQKRSLGNLESVTLISGKEKPPKLYDCSGRDKTTTTTITNTKTTTTKTTAILSTELYLELASEHYERRYLANVKYLESIPERNAFALIRSRTDEGNTSQKGTLSASVSTTASASFENNSNYSRSTSAKSNVSHTSTNTDETTITATSKRTNCELNSAIANLLRLIGRKRTFRIGCNNNTTAYDKFDNNTKNWAIRVNITPTPTVTPSIDESAGTQSKRKYTKKDQNTVPTNSMHDSCNSNLNTNFKIQNFETTSFQTNNNNQSANVIVPNLEAEWSTEHLHNIIDNLSQLDLNALAANSTINTQGQGLVPEITLTNYCDRTKNQYNDIKTPLNFDHLHNRTAKSASSACDSSSSLLVRATKFGKKPNLDIPSESNYQSESRPP